MCSVVDEDDLGLTNYLLKCNGDEEEPWESCEEISVGGESFGDHDGDIFELGWSLGPDDLDPEPFKVDIKPTYQKNEPASEVKRAKGNSSTPEKCEKKQPSEENVVSESESDHSSDVCEVESVKVASKPVVTVRSVCKNSAKIEQRPAKSKAEKAKALRERKKKYVEELEDTVAQLNRDKEGLQQVTIQLGEKIESFREEISYLKGVIANQSELAAILRSVANTPGIAISCRALENNECSGKVGNSKRKRDDSGKIESNLDNKNSKKQKQKQNSDTMGELNGKAGVCVHVQSGKVSVEFCAECSKKANGILP